MKLTTNFTLEELCESEIATANGIKNTPNKVQEAALRKLCENILQPLRDYLGEEVKSSSGFRCAKLNELAGGEPTSQHLKGEADDIKTAQMRKAFLHIQNNLPFDQLIWENGNDCKPQWIHVSYSSRNRRQILRKFTGVKGYKPFYIDK